MIQIHLDNQRQNKAKKGQNMTDKKKELKIMTRQNGDKIKMIT